jgi:Fe-S-cluster containining protein
MFECDKCGLCCSYLGESTIYASLDRGDGVCKYLDGNLCSIYENRPLLCRVDESYEKLFSNEMTRKEFYMLNYKGCLELKNKYENKERHDVSKST